LGRIFKGILAKFEGKFAGNFSEYFGKVFFPES
jgi:hypothetical protein